MIELKLWNGEKWEFVKCKFQMNREFKEEYMLSPSVVLHKGYDMIHIPINNEVLDVRKAQERMDSNENICGVAFTNSDCFAVCTAMNSKEEFFASTYLKGGKEYSHRCSLLVKKINKSNDASKENANQLNRNKKYYMHLYNLSDYYAHKVSKQIIDFCKANDCKVIVIGNFNKDYTRTVLKSSGMYSPFYLHARIIRYLHYKAWSEGIVITKVRPTNLASVCGICGAKLVKVNKDKRTCICANGHSSNTGMNSAKNLCKQCLIKFGKRVR